MAGKKNFCEIHQSKPRIDGVEKVSGKAVYAGDMLIYAGGAVKNLCLCSVMMILTAHL